VVLIFEREDFMSTRFRWTTQRSGANWGFNAFQLKTTALTVLYVPYSGVKYRTVLLIFERDDFLSKRLRWIN